MAHVNGPIRSRGPYPFDLRNLNRLIGRGGRIADTHDPTRYATVLRRLLRQYGNSLRYGFMLRVNVLLDGGSSITPAIKSPEFRSWRRWRSSGSSMVSGGFGRCWP